MGWSQREFHLTTIRTEGAINHINMYVYNMKSLTMNVFPEMWASLNKSSLVIEDTDING